MPSLWHWSHILVCFEMSLFLSTKSLWWCAPSSKPLRRPSAKRLLYHFKDDNVTLYEKNIWTHKEVIMGDPLFWPVKQIKSAHAQLPNVVHEFLSSALFPLRTCFILRNGKTNNLRYNSAHPNTRLKWQHPNRYFCLIWNVKDLAVCSTFEEVLASSAKVQANSNKEAVYVWPGEYYSQLLYHSRGLKCITYQKKNRLFIAEAILLAKLVICGTASH